jgi:hypothetical protein
MSDPDEEIERHLREAHGDVTGAHAIEKAPDTNGNMEYYTVLNRPT